jgi:hypothetical protein
MDKAGSVIFSASKDAMEVLLDALKKEKNATILSCPQMTALDNQLAVAFVGNEEEGLYIGIVPRMIDEHRVFAMISINQARNKRQVQGNAKENARIETLAALQDRVPLIISGSLKSDDGEIDKEIILCVTATIVPIAKTASKKQDGAVAAVAIVEQNADEQLPKGEEKEITLTLTSATTNAEDNELPEAEPENVNILKVAGTVVDTDGRPANGAIVEFGSNPH